MNQTEIDKAEQFVKHVEDIAVLLRGISIENVAEAVKIEGCERAISVLDDRKRAWQTLLREMSADMHSMVDKIEYAKNDATSCLAKAKAAMAVFNGSEFKEATNNLDRFVNLCERFQSLKSNGFLDTVIETIGRV